VFAVLRDKPQQRKYPGQVWRSICDEHPVMQQPLAVMDENSFEPEERFTYEIRFPDRARPCDLRRQHVLNWLRLHCCV
jgi:hypothetical protein